MPENEARGFDNIWFQQDGAICHTVLEKMYQLRERFGEQLFLRFGLVNWSSSEDG